MNKMIINEEKSPCDGCQKRTEVCHANCKEYSDYADACAKNRRRKWLAKEVDRAVSEAVGRYPGERRV